MVINYKSVPKVTIACVLVLVLLVAVMVGGVAGCKAFNRSQKRADANNAVKVTAINIRKAEQEAKIIRARNAAVQARAEQRIIEARGIKVAQQLIAGSLTPLYVQHEAIQAQQDDRQGDRTYIPVGPQGVPLVADVDGTSVK